MIFDATLGGLPDAQPAFKYPRFVIVHPELGVYLGSFLGLGIWSKLDPAGQEAAVSFASREEALACVNSWEPEEEEHRIRTDSVTVVPVDCSKERYATLADLTSAGVETWDPRS